MNYNELISVVVPAYNAQKDIAKCINSIQQQTYDNLEIIIINDGSRDQTYDIAIKMREKDDRIIVINKDNEGVSSARNDGIKKSSGKYVYFIDSDDYISENTIEDLYTEIIKSEESMPVCGFVNVYDDKENTGFSLYSKKTVLSKKDYMVKMSQYLYSVYYGALWNKLYNLDIIKKNNIKFEESISYAEDFVFNLQYIKYINKMIMLPEKYYFYYQGNSNSLTRNKDTWKLWKSSMIKFKNCIIEYKAMGIYDQCKIDIDTAIASEIIGPSYSIAKDKTINRNAAIEKIEELFSDNIVVDAVYNTKNPTMVHRIAKISMRLKNYEVFYFFMKQWAFIEEHIKKNG